MKKFWFLVFLFLSCKANRDNPYDPQSPNYIKEGRVKGRVTDMVGIPLEGVNVSTIPIKFSTTTDSIGEFVLNPDPGTWRFVAQLSSYATDTTDTININVGDTTIMNFLLNGIPVIKSACAISCQEDMGFPSYNVYWGYISCEVQDPDGIQDIDSVWVVVELDTGNFTQGLSFNAGIYEAEICESPYPNHELENLVGRPFTIHALDKKGTIGSSLDFYIPRIIYKISYNISPIDKDTLPQATPIDFVWRKINPIYPVVYRLILQYSNLDTVLTYDNILDTTVVIDSLPQAIYRWKVQAIDEFGNFSCSRATNFTVK